MPQQQDNAGGVIAAAVAAHVPRIGLEEKAPDFQRGLIAGLKEMGVALRAMNADLIVLQSAHWVSTFNWYATVQHPHRGVCVADEAPDLIPGLAYDRPGDPLFAQRLIEVLGAAGLPALVNDSAHYKWDYAAYVPLRYLDPQQKIPVVIIPTCVCADLAESMRVGELVDVAARDSGRKVIFISSCALSHKVVRGPHLWPSDERVALDRKFIDALRSPQLTELLAWFPEYCRETVAEMGGRVLATMLGTMRAMAHDGAALTGTQYGDYAPSSGSGNANVVVRRCT
jgi:3,4-dihydroxyphenylacetate 2,3-dioxygenase